MVVGQGWRGLWWGSGVIGGSNKGDIEVRITYIQQIY